MLFLKTHKAILVILGFSDTQIWSGILIIILVAFILIPFHNEMKMGEKVGGKAVIIFYLIFNSVLIFHSN